MRLLTPITVGVFILLASPLAWAQPARTDEPMPVGSVPKQVPQLQAIPQPNHQVSFQRDGLELARYHFGPDLRRPFVFPIIGPAGRSLTRLGHPHDPESHSHHNSVWISHADVNGASFWDDRGKGRIVHQRLEQFVDGPRAASVASLNAWLADSGKVLLRERRQTAVIDLGNAEWLLLIDLQLEAAETGVTLGKTPFGLLGVRVAKTIGVHDGGGTIRGSEGGLNEAGVFWKRARWVDYSGPITATAIEGLALFDHPQNPGHPAVFHVRDDGWMGAALTFDAPRSLAPGQPLILRYGLYVHRGHPSPAILDRQWQAFAQLGHTHTNTTPTEANPQVK